MSISYWLRSKIVDRFRKPEKKKYEPEFPLKLVPARDPGTYVSFHARACASLDLIDNGSEALTHGGGTPLYTILVRANRGDGYSWYSGLTPVLVETFHAPERGSAMATIVCQLAEAIETVSISHFALLNRLGGLVAMSGNGVTLCPGDTLKFTWDFNGNINSQ